MIEIETFSGNYWALPTLSSDWKAHNRAANLPRIQHRDHLAMLKIKGFDPTDISDDEFVRAMTQDAIAMLHTPPDRYSCAEQIGFSIKRAINDEDSVEIARSGDEPYFSTVKSLIDSPKVKGFLYRPNKETQVRIVDTLLPHHNPNFNEFLDFVTALSFLAIRGSELLVEDSASVFEMGDRATFDQVLDECASLPNEMYGPKF